MKHPAPRHPPKQGGHTSARTPHVTNGHTADSERHLCDLELKLTALRSRNEDLEEGVKSLQESRDYYAGLLDCAPVGYVVLDEIGGVHDLNQILGSMLGLGPGDQARTSFARFIAKEDLIKFLKHLRQGKVNRKRVTTELSMKTAAGHLFPAELISVPLEHARDGPVTRLRTVVIDISERRAAEKALERTNWDYQRLLDSISGIVWEADARTLYISFVSRSAERLLGYPLQHWYRHGFWGDHIYYDDREAVLNSLQTSVAEGKGVVLEYRMLSSTRRLIWVRDTVAVRQRGGKPMLCGVAVDITEVKQKEGLLRQAHEQLEVRVADRTRELRETVAELESFSYSLSHDMRAPLRAIQGYSQLLLNSHRERLDPSARDYLKRMMASSERLDNLIQDVLRYSKLTRSPVELERINLYDIISEIINEYPAFQPPNAQIEIRKPVQPVVANKAFLGQCISNLLANAVKFHKEGEAPRIRISTRLVESHVEIVFEDNGIGIAPQDQQRIFGIFQRVHAGHEFEGTGIGLAIVQRAVERMGGSVGVESAAGQGSKFWLQLPNA